MHTIERLAVCRVIAPAHLSVASDKLDCPTVTNAIHQTCIAREHLMFAMISGSHVAIEQGSHIQRYRAIAIYPCTAIYSHAIAM